MRLRYLAPLLFFWASNAFAQNTPVYQSGLPKTGHASAWISNGVIGDAGPASAGALTELGITNSGTPFCINDAAPPGPYHQLCFGALALGGGLLNYGPYNGGSTLPFSVTATGPLILNSQTQQIEAKNLPLTLTGNVQLCVSPTTGVLSQASTGGCGAGPAPPQFLLLQASAGDVLLQGGAGRIQLQ